MTDPFSPQAQEHIPRSVACVVAVDASGVTTEASSTPGPAYSAWIIINQHIPEHRTVSPLATSTVLPLPIIQTGGISAHSIAQFIDTSPSAIIPLYTHSYRSSGRQNYVDQVEHHVFPLLTQSPDSARSTAITDHADVRIQPPDSIAITGAGGIDVDE